MGHKVTVNHNQSELPNGLQYQTGQSVVLSDEDFSKISSTAFTSGDLTDGGSYPPVQGFGFQSDDQVLNGGLVQLGNSLNPARSTVRREDVTTDVAATLVTTEVTLVAVALFAGDVITKIAVKSGATAANTPLNQWFALYSAAALLGQTADQTTTAWGANTVKDLSLVTAVTIATTGIYYVGIGVKATAVPSLPSKVLPLAGVSVGLLAGQATLAQITSGAALTGTAPAGPISGLASIAASVNVPYVVLH